MYVGKRRQSGVSISKQINVKVIGLTKTQEFTKNWKFQFLTDYYLRFKNIFTLTICTESCAMFNR